MLLGALMSTECARLVSLTIDELTQTNPELSFDAYRDFVDQSLGSKWGRYADISSAIAVFGMCCNGLIIVASNLRICMSSAIGIRELSLILIPFSLVYTFANNKWLKVSSIVGPAVCIGCVGVVGAGSAAALQERLAWPPAYQNVHGFFRYWPQSASEAGEVAAYMFYCFAIVVSVPFMKSRMKSPQRLPCTTNTSILCCFLVLGTVMCLGYMAFGSKVPDNIVDGFRSDRPPEYYKEQDCWQLGEPTVLGRVMGAMMVIHVMATDTVYVPLCVSCIGAGFPITRNAAACSIPDIGLKISFSLARSLLAAFLPYFLEVTALVSALFNASINIILPIAAYHQVFKGRIPVIVRILHGIMFIFGLFVAVLGTIGATQSIIAKVKSDLGASS